MGPSPGAVYASHPGAGLKAYPSWKIACRVKQHRHTAVSVYSPAIGRKGHHHCMLLVIAQQPTMMLCDGPLLQAYLIEEG